MVPPSYPHDADSGSTAFLPPERASTRDIESSIESITDSPVLSEILQAVGGLVAVLNPQRQIIALNETALQQLGVDDPTTVLGLRMGEALQCRYAHDPPCGCGTTEKCRSCGAAIAMAAVLASDQAHEETCAIAAGSDGDQGLHFHIRACPVQVADRRFILIFMRDVSHETARSALERTFFHDINNTISSLSMLSDILLTENDSSERRACMIRIQELSARLAREVDIQRMLIANPSPVQIAVRQPVPVAAMVAAMDAFARSHRAARGKQLIVHAPAARESIETDQPLAERVLTNMLVNAFEATPPGGEVDVSVMTSGTNCVFRVWNAAPVDPEIAPRVFQRSYSTKNQPGRGTGTYSMRLIGEKVLGGQVWFTSNPEDGTAFYFALPRNHHSPGPPHK